MRSFFASSFVKPMIPLILGGLLTLTVGTVYYYKKRREALEAKQLQMFIEQLVWDPDDKKFVTDHREEILPLRRLKNKTS